MGCTPSKSAVMYSQDRVYRDLDTCSTIVPSLKSSVSTPEKPRLCVETSNGEQTFLSGEFSFCPEFLRLSSYFVYKCCFMDLFLIFLQFPAEMPMVGLWASPCKTVGAPRAALLQPSCPVRMSSVWSPIALLRPCAPTPGAVGPLSRLQPGEEWGGTGTASRVGWLSHFGPTPFFCILLQEYAGDS